MPYVSNMYIIVFVAVASVYIYIYIYLGQLANICIYLYIYIHYMHTCELNKTNSMNYFIGVFGTFLTAICDHVLRTFGGSGIKSYTYYIYSTYTIWWPHIWWLYMITPYWDKYIICPLLHGHICHRWWYYIGVSTSYYPLLHNHNIFHRWYHTQIT